MGYSLYQGEYLIFCSTCFGNRSFSVVTDYRICQINKKDRENLSESVKPCGKSITESSQMRVNRNRRFFKFKGPRGFIPRGVRTKNFFEGIN